MQQKVKEVLTVDVLLGMYKTAMQAREVELVLFALWSQGRTRALFSGAGAEITGAVLTQLLKSNDYLIPRFRGYSAAIGKGVSFEEIIAEMMGLSSGVNAGAGGATPFHSTKHNIPYYSINLGANFSVADGIALGLKKRNVDSVVAILFGDGEVTRTTFPASLNIASLWSLPVIFVCEANNQCDQMDTNNISASSAAVLANAYGIESAVVCDSDSEQLCTVMENAVGVVRRGKPYLVEVIQYRHTQHSSGYHFSFAAENIDTEKDSLRSFENYLVSKGVPNQELTAIKNSITEKVDQYVSHLTSDSLNV